MREALKPRALSEVLMETGMAIPRTLHPRWSGLFEPAVQTDLEKVIVKSKLNKVPLNISHIVQGTYERIEGIPLEEFEDFPEGKPPSAFDIIRATAQACEYLTHRGCFINPDVREDIQRHIASGGRDLIAFLEEIRSKRMGNTGSSYAVAMARGTVRVRGAKGHVVRKGIPTE